MSALFNDVHNTTTTDDNEVTFADLVGTVGAEGVERMLRAFQRHTSGDVDDMPDTTDTGEVIPPWAFDDHEDMTFDPWIS